ncbi:MAG TPA: AIR synthase related protein, partial [Polyangiales bacterium]|nr:AIR synthase related protein [Polyangiales bacterium]
CKVTAGYDPLDEKPIARDPRVVVDIPIPMLVDAAPKYDRPQREVVRDPIASQVIGPSVTDASAELLALVGSPNIGSRAWVYRQYDHVVRDGTVFRPGETDAAIVRVFCEDGERTIEKYLALSVDCNGRHVQLDPHMGAAMAVAECARNLACVGAEALGLTDCLNFGSPEKPDTMWRFSRSIDGIRDACNALGIPVVSGNVSLYNETEGQPILPTPTVAIVGQLQDVAHRVGLAFTPGHSVALLGVPARGSLGGSEWLTQKVDDVTGEPVGIDLAAEARLQKLLISFARQQLLASAHDVSDGGIAVCLAESCIARGVGAQVKLGLHGGRELAKLWSEEPSRVILSYAPEHERTLRSQAEGAGVPFTVIGTTGGTELSIDAVVRVPVTALAKAHREALDAVVA